MSHAHTLTCAHLTPSPRLRGEGWGEGRVRLPKYLSEPLPLPGSEAPRIFFVCELCCFVVRLVFGSDGRDQHVPGAILVVVNDDTPIVPLIWFDLRIAPRALVVAGAGPFVRPAGVAFSMSIVFEKPSHRMILALF
jgi:hypothetical protein